MTSKVRTISIQAASVPLFWVKWSNVFVLCFFVGTLTSLPHALFASYERGADLTLTLLVFMAFPAFLAWKNINVVSALTQRWTVRSQLFLAVNCMLFAAVIWYSQPSLRDDADLRNL